MSNELGLVKHDKGLHPYSKVIHRRYTSALKKEIELIGNDGTLSSFANGHFYFGLQKIPNGWVFREWAPAANKVYLIGDFNGWRENESYRLYPIENGVWEVWLDENQLTHGQHYKLMIHGEKGRFERIPAWAQRVVQNPGNNIFSAQVWQPEEAYQFKHPHFIPAATPLLIYECHVGMAVEEERVGTFNEFREQVLPHIAACGYNTIQLMALQEHPYYGSFGYQVSSFFAPSSRFGTPEELKQLIDTAHELGIAVIMDIIHSHAVINQVEGLGCFDGTEAQYFHQGDRRIHPAWGSLCFDYGKNEVVHFLLSNCKYWMEEFKLDGFRFDGVTSMLYYSHGLNETFNSYDKYFDGQQDEDAITYLTLANKLIHQIKPHAITIAEEMSGMPGIATKQQSGGIGFDYRMAMGIPDYWIKLIKERKDENWLPGEIFWELTNRRAEEKTISYVESHDQALVGDKTIIFRLIDEKMYWGMESSTHDMVIDRGMALHKMIRLVTASTINGGYLNFMGNEFGHPEWIDFPRQGNGWSYKYARRLWSLATNPLLRYQYLFEFDKAMVKLLSSEKRLQSSAIDVALDSSSDQVLAFMRDQLLFIFNFNPSKSFTDYGILVQPGKYQVVLDTDSPQFGGFGLNDENLEHFTIFDPLYKEVSKEWLQVYLPARSALVLRNKDAIS